MRRGQDPHVHPHRAVAPHRLELAVLQDAEQPGLERQRQLRDLVEEQRPAVGHHQPPRTRAADAGERALHVPEQLQLQRPVRDRSAAQRDEGVLGALRPGVDGPRQALLAGARLAPDEHRRAGARHLACPPQQRLHPRAADPPFELRSAAELLLHQLGVNVVLLVQPLERDRLARALHGDGQQLRVHLDQVDHRRRIDLADGAVQGEDAERLVSGDERRDQAGVPRRQVEHVIERVSVAVPVVLLEEGPGSARLQRLLDRGELLQRERVLSDAVVGERAARGAHHQPALLEHEHRRQVVRRDARQPVEAAAEHVVDGLLGAHQRGELLEVPGEVHRAKRGDGGHGRESNGWSTDLPVPISARRAPMVPISRCSRRVRRCQVDDLLAICGQRNAFNSRWRVSKGLAKP